MTDENININDKLSSEAEIHLKLANLLQKERNEEKKNKVAEILQKDLTTEEKIKEIEEIDSKSSYISIKREETSPDIQELLQKENLINASESSSRIKNIKIKHTKNTFFRFLLYDFKRINNFGRKTHILSCSIIPGRVKMYKSLPSSFNKYLQNDVREIIKFQNFILDRGWQYLEKFEYNLIVVFFNLLKEISSINFKTLNMNDQNLIDKLASLERYFIVCNYKSNYVGKIISAVKYVLSKDAEMEAKSKNVTNLIKAVLKDDVQLPSLHNFILGLNMMKYRKFLKLDDIFIPNVQIINNFDFDCDPVIRKKINVQIKTLLQELVYRMGQIKEINRIKNYLPRERDGVYDVTEFKYFYEEENTNTKADLNKDKKNILAFSQLVFRTYIRVFEPLLKDKIQTDKDNKIRIFSPEYFQFEIDKIVFLIDKLTSFNYSQPNFTLSRYHTLKSLKKGGIETEVEIMQIINELLMLTKEIAKKLINVEKFHNPVFKDQMKEKAKFLTPSIVMSKQFCIPSYDKKIISDNIFNNKTVFTVINYIIRISLLIEIIFEDDYLPLLMSKEEHIAADIISRRENLMRLTTIFKYNKLKERFEF